ncbi:DNA polymerase III subunit chi [Caenimonas sp. SL110]|uniref:DNA polymerase III subunit chi n=1 Tax=Caenimonas sp. SL110 TaxID=1450524 RepID=UPI000652F824|nr:DNA polymerase III subunit chi [Caenimonas sp. SL110]
MTDVEFHFNAPDKMAYACRLLRKAAAKGSRVAVTADADFLRELDRTLWTFDPVAFVPHCVHDAPPQVRDVSPVVLCDSARSAPHAQVLINFGGEVPDGFERFERVIEVVSLDEDDKVGARRRYRHYADRGYAIARRDLVLKEA